MENCPAAEEFTAKKEYKCLANAREAGWSFQQELKHMWASSVKVYCPKCTKARSHEDSRLCLPKSIQPAEDRVFREDQLPEVLVSCTCGRTKKYVAGEAQEYVFICNGV